MNEEEEEDEGEEREPDDSSWASWLKEIYSYIDYIKTTYIGKQSVVSTWNQTTVPRRKPLFKHNLWNEFKLVRGGGGDGFAGGHQQYAGVL